MNSKRKGNAGELELLHLLEAAGLSVQRNDQRFIGGMDNPDISLECGGKRYHLEVKRAERFNAYMKEEVHRLEVVKREFIQENKRTRPERYVQ